ncbi:four helix bundle protein [Lutibacter sp. HS1-25]|uniref:four helix bundle protein n=1 Tax=Lutibacter sp. HS1-25 TaxID=2485000 RepID=UPI00101284EF|nr:four helix bundle protein [Lutibacter sp. HS1-25]RXP63625.1 four helix bundle protein [Lutibacter sp. HS1-25]
MIDYKNYKVWQKSHNLVSQIKSASISIPTNIAEGCGRETQKELVRFLYISSGSAHELDYLFLISSELNLIPQDKANPILVEIDQIKRMLASLITKIKSTI